MISTNIDYENWLSPKRWDVAVELHFKGNVGRTRAERTARQFWYDMDHLLLGKRKAKRHKQCLVRACFLEADVGYKKWHYLCAVKLPVKLLNSADTICQDMQLMWQGSKLADGLGLFEPISYGPDWISYISKGEGQGKNTFCVVTSRL